MIEDIAQISQVRKSLNLTQKELARRSGVSQSLIAKIESGRIDPAYSNARKIFEAIESLHQKSEKTAGQMMVRQIIKLTPDDSIKSTILKMRKHKISQLPVFEGKQAVGLISEMILLDAVTDGASPDSIVRDIMEEAPPTVPDQATFTIVSRLLKEYPIVIVSSKGIAKGIITKSDMLNLI